MKKNIEIIRLIENFEGGVQVERARIIFFVLIILALYLIMFS